MALEEVIIVEAVQTKNRTAQHFRQVIICFFYQCDNRAKDLQAVVT